MHIFTALLFTNDDSTAISTKRSQGMFQKTKKPKEKFQLQQFLKDKLLEPSVKKIYGKVWHINHQAFVKSNCFKSTR